MSISRGDGRASSQLRPVLITPGISPYAEGSAEVCFGSTKVLITASVLKEVPRWMSDDSRGWITAEYGMLPRSTHTRNSREAARGKQGGRTLEIQRLIGRALRQAVRLEDIPGITIQIDCDVICADGGTRTASITGGWVALYQAISWAKEQGLVKEEVEVTHVSAISAGVFGGTPILDLCYEEDSTAEFDCNFVFNGKGEIIEIQGTGEDRAISSKELIEVMELASSSIEEITAIQNNAIN